MEVTKRKLHTHCQRHHVRYLLFGCLLVVTSFISVYLEMHGLGTGLGIGGTVILALADL